MKNIAIIGGGAAGLSASVEALRTAKEQKVPVGVTVYEKLPRVGKKILAAGNGRCNLCNSDISVKNYRGNEALINAVLSSHFSDTVKFFNSLGLLTKEESGRIYPKSESASSVADALRFTALSLGCKIIPDTHIIKIEKQKDGFLLNNTIFADAVIMACGGAASPVYGSDGSGFTLLGTLGHKVTKLRPALVSVKCADGFFKSLKGIRADAAAVLLCNGHAIFEDIGEIQFTEYGLSGIPIFNLSGLIDTERKAEYTITLDLCRDMTLVALLAFLESAVRQGKPSAADVLSGLLQKRLGEVVLKRCGVSHAEKPENLSTETLNKIARTIKTFSARVTGTSGFSKAQITAGGVFSEEINLDSLSSRIADGLYICGELLDFDGLCGGYNLHFAWTSGRIAGFNAVMRTISNDKS